MEVAPPPAYDLTVSATHLWIGAPATFTIEGMQPGARYGLFASDVDSEGEVFCPDFMLGECADLAGLVFRIGGGFADADGRAEVHVTVPPSAVAADIVVQALSLEGNAWYLTPVTPERLIDPMLEDQDGDGLTDYDELVVHGTDPLLDDTDGDGVLDGEQVGGE
jgi:hypothetical protein